MKHVQITIDDIANTTRQFIYVNWDVILIQELSIITQLKSHLF